MRLAKAANIPLRASRIGQFGGYDTRPAAAENTFCAMENLSADAFPALTARGRRAKVQSVGEPAALAAHNGLAWVADGQFVFNGAARFALTPGEKQLVGMGANICIFPDKLIYSTVDGTVTPMDNETAVQGAAVTVCDSLGVGYDAFTGPLPPDDPQEGDCWLEEDDEGAYLRQWSETAGEWLPVTDVCMAIAAMGIGAGFKAGDGVEISGTGQGEGGHILLHVTHDLIVTDGALSRPRLIQGEVRVSRKSPPMDFVAELNNRLWGVARSGREISACKLGDATNWSYFNGLSADSFRMTVGSPGAFTGAVGFQGEMLFFKEDRILKVMGTQPSNYQLTELKCRGVAAGSEKSLCAVDETLYWLSREGVMATGGGLPQKVSHPIDGPLTHGVGGGVNGRYYLYARDEAGAGAVYVYRGDRDIWHREDDANVKCFAFYRGELYWLNGEGDLMAARGILPYTYTENGVPQTEREGEVAFSAVTPMWDLSLPHAKYLRRLSLRAALGEGAALTVKARYDSHGDWVTLGSCAPGLRRACDLPLHPRRCDHLQLRLEGRGDVTVYSLTRETEAGN